ncbi:hypothetical protein [Nocardioides sp.]|uniref:hypothetical protein n=1 Tax=Nocardioides sp. TaxID=35761 RepID=UPI0035B3FCBD
MQLHAVVVPPAANALAALEAAQELAPPPVVVDEPKPGLLDRLRGRREPEPVEEAPVVTLVPEPPEAVRVRLAKFGNVTTNDAGALAAALEAEAGAWRVPVVYVAALAVGAEHPFEVTARLEGDVDSLRDLYRNVNEVAQSERFFLDRRGFRSEMVLGTLRVDDGSPPPLAGVEVPFRGAYWSPSHVSLLRASYGAGGTTFAEYARIDLADGAEEPVALG